MRWWLFVTTLMVVACGITAASADGLRLSKELDVQGHRGARSVLPENTLAGFAYALKVGANTIELDLAVTRDMVVVVHHDQTVNRILCRTKAGDRIREDLWIHDLSLAEIKMFDCGSVKNRFFPKQQTQAQSEIPSLIEVLEMVVSSALPQAEKLRFNLEAKTSFTNPSAQPTADKFVALILQSLEHFKLTERTTIQSFDPRILAAVKEQAPHIERSILLGDRPRDWIATARKTNATIVSPYYKNLKRRDVELMQRAGLKVIPWTVNYRKDWARLIEMKVDGIITDDPANLLAHIGR